MPAVSTRMPRCITSELILPSRASRIRPWSSGGSEYTRDVDATASMLADSVEPQRDSWNTRPAGRQPEASAGAPAAPSASHPRSTYSRSKSAKVTVREFAALEQPDAATRSRNMGVDDGFCRYSPQSSAHMVTFASERGEETPLWP